MSLRVAIQMDPVESIDIRGDTSFALGLEAQNRGHELHYYLPDSLTLADAGPKLSAGRWRFATRSVTISQLASLSAGTFRHSM
ncbi:MAG: hypothetical protein CM15mP115_14500 [Alphaproteobacteria bacterium]|nr:MAG: hypothetical protein CM15mP115_14500 [Alphaproteobacteria bacterium]